MTLPLGVGALIDVLQPDYVRWGHWQQEQNVVPAQLAVDPRA